MTSVSAVSLAIADAARSSATTAALAVALRGRRCSLLVGDTEIVSLPDGLRVTFAIEKTDTRTANKATITIANLSRDTRARIEAAGQQRVILEAGYTNAVGAVFTGTAYRANTKQVGADLITTLECADGGKEIGRQAGAWSFSRGASVAAIVGELVAALGLPLSSGSRIAPSRPTLPRAWAFAGGVAGALDSITAATGLVWSVQDGQVQVFDAADVSDGSEAVRLSAASGMVGSPEPVEVKEGDKVVGRVSVVALIQPQIRPSRVVEVDSIVRPELSGVYVVRKQKITGDSHGPDWTTTLELSRR